MHQILIRLMNLFLYLASLKPLFAIFRASSHSSLAPPVDIRGIWPLKGIAVLDPREIPFLNTLIPLSSRAFVTWAQHVILAGKEKRARYVLVATVSLALVFWAINLHMITKLDITRVSRSPSTRDFKRTNSIICHSVSLLYH
ncbi:putative cytochrome-c oxidase [Helianthus annuus]|nr:putative cytochrome-c oxidase [Helianthus annuus]